MRFYLYILIALLFTGCGFKSVNEQVDIKDKVQLNEPSNWRNTQNNQSVTAGWLKTFNDPILIQLAEEVLQNNKELNALKLQAEYAKVLVQQAAAALKPTLELSGLYSSRNALGFDEIYGANLTLNWEADVWGRLTSAQNAVQESAQASLLDYEFARQSIIASTAKAWFMLNHTQAQVDYSKSLVQLYEKDLEIMQAKYKIGQVDQRSIHLAKANLSNAKNSYSKILTAYENAQRSLELLLGRYPSALIESKNELTILPQAIPTGMPSQLIERRPDLIAAQRRVAAAFYKTQEAKLLHLPRFNFSIGALVNNITNAITDLSLGLFAPLYTGGAIEAEVDKATLVQKQSIEQYAQVALVAFKEVETALTQEMRLAQQESYLKAIVQENQEALKLTKIRFNVGKVDYLEVSQIQNRLIASEVSLIDISNQRLFNRVNLHLALGGDFE